MSSDNKFSKEDAYQALELTNSWTNNAYSPYKEEFYMTLENIRSFRLQPT